MIVDFAITLALPVLQMLLRKRDLLLSSIFPMNAI